MQKMDGLQCLPCWFASCVSQVLTSPANSSELKLCRTLRLQIFSCILPSLPEVQLQNLDSLPYLPHFKPHLPNHILDCHPFQIVPCGQPAGWKYRPLNVFKISWNKSILTPSALETKDEEKKSCCHASIAVLGRREWGSERSVEHQHFHIFSDIFTVQPPNPLWTRKFLQDRIHDDSWKFKTLPFSGAVLHHPKACPQKIEWKFVAWTSSSWQAFLLPTPLYEYRETYHEEYI